MATYSSNSTIAWDSAVDSTIYNGVSNSTYTVPSGKFFRGQIVGTNNAVAVASVSINGTQCYISQGIFELGAGQTIAGQNDNSARRVVGNLYKNTP